MDGVAGLEWDALERARRSRDRRFDGKFFIAVRSTRIFCRPICPSPTSKPQNVRYFATATEATEAGYRPCLRCRPEAAPGSPAWLGTSAVVRRALRLIRDGALDNGSVDALACRLGVGTRHLNRLFTQHVGASPNSIAQTRRLQFAKRLLDETDLSITQIALAAGYGSVRRFNRLLPVDVPTVSTRAAQTQANGAARHIERTGHASIVIPASLCLGWHSAISSRACHSRRRTRGRWSYARVVRAEDKLATVRVPARPMLTAWSCAYPAPNQARFFQSRPPPGAYSISRRIQREFWMHSVPIPGWARW